MLSSCARRSSMSESAEQKETPTTSTSVSSTSSNDTTTAVVINTTPVVVSKPVIAHVEGEVLTINQQLSNHLATTAALAAQQASPQVQQQQQQQQVQGQVFVVNAKPAAKRKRGSLDQRSPLAIKVPLPVEAKKIGFIGAGNMARAISEGWITAGAVKPANLTATVRNLQSHNLKYMKSLGVNVTASNRDVIGQCDIIIIAVKPYQVMEIMQEIHKIFKSSGSGGHPPPKALRPVVVSVAASVPLAELERKAEINWNIGGSPITGHLPIIRCVPNLSCGVQSGVTVFSRGKYCNEEDIKPFITLFSLLGHCEEMEERYMDSFVALTGSGLAFMEIALEAMADGGVLAGLPHPLALRMSAHTMIGAANLVLKKNLHPAQVKNYVCSPAGTTISGVLALENGGFRAALISAVKAAVDRAAELRQSN